MSYTPVTKSRCDTCGAAFNGCSLHAAAPELVAESQATADELTGLVEWLDSIDAAPAIARKLLRIVDRHRAALAKVKGEGG